jgi:hypothetical protein
MRTDFRSLPKRHHVPLWFMTRRAM